MLETPTSLLTKFFTSPLPQPTQPNTSGNASESYIQAGFIDERTVAEASASRLLRNVKVMAYIEERNKELDSKFIADIEETKRFWTEIMRDSEAEIKTRLKASEYIAKTNVSLYIRGKSMVRVSVR